MPHSFIALPKDIKRMQTLKDSFIVVISPSKNKTIHQTLISWVIETIPDTSFIVHNPIIQKENKPLQTTEQWLKWDDVVHRPGFNKIIHIYSIPSTVYLNTLYWKRIFQNEKLEKEMFRRIREHHLPIILTKILPPATSDNFTLKSIMNKHEHKTSTTLKMRSLMFSNFIFPEDLHSGLKLHEFMMYVKCRMNLIGVNNQNYFQALANQWLGAKSNLKQIAEKIPDHVIEEELNHLESECLLIESGTIRVYYAPFNSIPWTLQEIGRLREITFRNANEGSGNQIDLDRYDPLYYHLFAWELKERRIIGAYRLAEGHKIIPLTGRKGFYVSSLFKITKPMNKILLQSVELGRSFIVPEYQKSHRTLLLLWQGIYLAVTKNSNNKYIIGPVSISQNYSKISRVLIMEYLNKYHRHAYFYKHVIPRKPFRIFNKWPYKKIILSNLQDDIHKFEHLLSEVHPEGQKLPVLLRQYLKQNAKVLAFNLDPKFQNTLDALVILELKDLQEHYKFKLLDPKNLD